ncbi:MAG TPA: hypothetical protein P5106_02725 [Caldisericia bacterium]|nr:hypothetical protein [Caldisericia bacterium]
MSFSSQETGKNKMANKWNRNPGSQDDNLATEVIKRSIQYGLLGYLPEELCAVVIVDGEHSSELALMIEDSGYAVTRLCDRDKDIPGCTPESLDELPDRSFGMIVTQGWLCGDGEFEDVARMAFSKLREGGLFVASVPGKIAVMLDLSGDSAVKAMRMIDSPTTDCHWDGVDEAFEPNELAVTLEAIGFELVDIYGWQVALNNIPAEVLLKKNWDEKEIEDIIKLEYILSQNRTLLGAASTIQFVARRPNPAERISNLNPEDVPSLDEL